MAAADALQQPNGGTGAADLASDIKSHMREFKRRLSMDVQRLCETTFRTVSFDDLERFISGIQQREERLGTLMGFRRLGPVLRTFRDFDSSLNSLEIDDEGFKGYLWGPMHFVLEVRRDFRDFGAQAFVQQQDSYSPTAENK
jgi:hypothetical protein